MERHAEQSESLAIQLSSLRRQVDELEAKISARTIREKDGVQSRGRVVKLASIFALAAVFAAAVVVADPVVSLTCPGGDLFCFNANTPARSSEVNHNFAQVQSWLEQKVGPAGSGTVTLSTSSGPALQVENGHMFYAKNSGGVYEPFLWPRWSDNRLYLNYGSDGMRLRNNSSVIQLEFNAAGNATFSQSANFAGGLSVSGTAIGTYIRDYIRNNCRIYVGWRDSCNDCGSTPQSYSSNLVNGGSCSESGSGETWCNGSWAAVGFEGTMNGDEAIFVAMNCN